jgi:hypothetical protein
VTVANFDANPVQAAVQLAGFDLRAAQYRAHSCWRFGMMYKL